MKRLSLVLVLALFAAEPALGGTKQIARAIEGLTGQEASFTQRFLPRGYKKEQLESGRVIFGPEASSRWTYQDPEPKTFVFDGTTSWMYVPADEAVTVHEVTTEEKELLPFFVLSDAARLSDWYEIEDKGTETVLTARDAEALLQSIVIELDEAGRLSRLQYTDGQGNRTTFELDDWSEANQSDETFTFDPPDGVDVIHN